MYQLSQPMLANMVPTTQPPLYDPQDMELRLSWNMLDNMKHIASLVLTYYTLNVLGDSYVNHTNVLEFVSGSLAKEIVDIRQPIDETIVAIGSSQCDNVKKFFGMTYNQIKNHTASEPDLNSLSLWFRTKEAAIIFNITDAGEAIRQARSFKPNDRLLIFIHGFTDNPHKKSFHNFSDSYFKRGDTTSVIALDGSPLLYFWYLRASTCVRFIGEKLGEMFAGMVQNGLDPSLIHMVGHSLGAHISGFTGKRFHELTGQRLGRISGLDPAGPCFSHIDEGLRLKATDADYVDVVHTDAKVFGIEAPAGHADYYPNSGSKQPSCILQACSHTRSWLYYGESAINEKAFPAVRCASWEAFKKGDCDTEISYMGHPSKPGTRGIFFLQTGPRYPFGLGLEGTKYKDIEGLVSKIENFLG